MFIKRLNIQGDPAAVLEEFNGIISEGEPQQVWRKMNQLGFNHRPTTTNIWEDATGSLFDRINNTWRGRESDFTNWNIPPTSTIRQQINHLQSTIDVPLGRIRIMRLLPRTGLSVHKDLELRYHLVLQTNPKAYIAHETNDIDPQRSDLPTTAATYHLPLDNYWYQIDTRETHWVYNGGTQERIHVVVCGT